MLYLLINHHRNFLIAHHLGFLRIFTFVTFQAIAAVLFSFLFVLVFAPPIINWLRKQKIGDLPDFDQAEMNKIMASKASTPTMGGLLIISAIAVTSLLFADLSNFYVKMALICLLWLGAVGAIDDWLKLTRTPAARKPPVGGLTGLEKLLFQIGLAVILAFFTHHHGEQIENFNRLYFPFLKHYSLPLGLGAFVAIATFIVVGFSNAVNLTRNGLDGLASGCMAHLPASRSLFSCLIVGGVHEIRQLPPAPPTSKPATKWQY